MITRSKFPFLSEKDVRIRIMNEHINVAENHFGELCSAFAAFNRKLGRYRDKHDDLAKVLKAYSDEEIPNNSLTLGLDSFSKAITLLSDYIDLEIQRIDLQIVNEMKQYENICRSTRESLKAAVTIRDKEVLRQKQLIELKTKFNANTSTGDSELLKINIEVNKTNKEIENIIENFEKRKLKDLKNLLLDFIQIHLKEHTKAVEVLSAAYQDISNIDEKKDFQTFKKSVRIRENSNEFNRLLSQSADNLAVRPSTLNENEKHRQFSRSTKDLTKPFGIGGKLNKNDTNEEYDDDENDDEDSSNGESNEDDSSGSRDSDSEEDEEEEQDGIDNLLNKPTTPSTRINRFKQISESIDVSKSSRTTTPTKISTTDNDGNNLITVRSINEIFK